MATATKAKTVKVSTANPKRAPKRAPKKAKAKVKTLISILLDRSGSMSSVRESTIAGFNEFLDGQRELADVEVSLTQFDDHYEVNFTKTPLEDVPALDTNSFIPRGSTALNDSIAHAVQDTAEAAEPGQRVLFVIITDGYENASREFAGPAGLAKVSAMIQEKENQDWTFIFMGADIDAFAVSESFNIPAGNTVGYSSTPRSASASFMAVAGATSDYLNSSEASVDNFTQTIANSDEFTTSYDDEPKKKGTLTTKSKKN